MSALSKKLRACEGGRLSFYCLGCKTSHTVTIGPNAWGWNGDAERPTFSPSVLVRQGHFAYDQPRDTCWCTYNAAQEDKGEKPSPFTCQICHSFVTDGRIQFLGDCTHHLAGQTVDLPDWDESC